MTDIHKRIREAREERGLTRDAFGTAIGATAAKVQALEGGRQRVDHLTLEALSRNLGVDANWLLLGKDNHHSAPQNGQELSPKSGNTVSQCETDFIPIPRFDVEAAAGTGANVSGEQQNGAYAFSRSWLTRRGLDARQLAVISVRGDSMEPKLRSGDLILIDQAQSAPSDGDTYVIRIGDELVVKQLQLIASGRIALLSANASYPPRELTITDMPDDTAIIGRVVASMHEW